jgi:integrase
VRLSARKGVLRVVCKGERLREVPIHPQLRRTLADWLQERRDWEGAIEGSALCLNRRGSRLSARGAHDVITGIAARAGLDDRVTAHVLQHSFATTLVRGGTDLVIAAELLGHARLETTRVYTRPSAEDRRKAVELLPVDERGSVLRGELEVSAPRCFEAGAPGVELVAQLGEAVLGEVPGLDPEAGGDQLERSAARVLAT